VTVETPESDGRLYRCGATARWLPRILAAALLVSALLAADRLAPRVRLAGWGLFAPAVVLLGGLLALAVVRQGGEVRRTVRFSAGAVLFGEGKRRFELPFERIETLAWEPPFATRRRWVPALSLVDRDGRSWRIPAFIERGEQLIAELLRRSGRNDLAAWSEALRLASRLGRPARAVSIGYLVALVILVLGLVFYLHPGTK
jgi:hypothetical protein